MQKYNKLTKQINNFLFLYKKNLNEQQTSKINKTVNKF